ncbi:MAG: Zn-ribbon domain-containing OB-fold protein [Ignavibacteriales bacterium]
MGAHVSVPSYRRSLPQRYMLQALKCGKCGRVIFPPKGCCPECGQRAGFVPFRLRPEGEVFSFTELSAAGAPPEFGDLARTRKGYVVGIVKLDDGPSIMAQLSAATGPVEIGRRVRGVFKRIYAEEGIVRYGMKFETR